MKSIKWIVLAGIAFVVLTAVPKHARADDCLEVGWRDRDSQWTYYRAWVDAYDTRAGRVHIKYDFHKGQLELKVREKENAEGTEVIVLRGRWFEGRDKQRSGRVRLEMEKGHHRAKGWYTYGDDDNGTHYDFVLRDCKRNRDR